jgi:hypothetical protein
LVKSTPPAPQDAAKTLERQKAYDTYSAERDPATGLFAAMFGGAWAGDFVHNFLFSMSERPDGAPAISQGMPFMGGPPQGKGAPPTSQGAPQQAPKVAQPVAARRR